MSEEIVYPVGCKPIDDDLGPDELIRRLKVSSRRILNHPMTSITSLPAPPPGPLAHVPEPGPGPRPQSVHPVGPALCRGTVPDASLKGRATTDRLLHCRCPAGVCPRSTLQGPGTDQGHLLLLRATTARTKGSQGHCLQAILLPAGESGLRQVVQHVLRAGRVPGHLLSVVHHRL